MKMDDRDYLDMLRVTVERFNNALLGFPQEYSKEEVGKFIARLSEINAQREPARPPSTTSTFTVTGDDPEKFITT